MIARITVLTIATVSIAIPMHIVLIGMIARITVLTIATMAAASTIHIVVLVGMTTWIIVPMITTIAATSPILIVVMVEHRNVLKFSAPLMSFVITPGLQKHYVY
jgi:Flp pilus assembly protein TadB